jgi:Uma2 family endonuclease
MATTQERMTLEAFLELPEEEPALEFENGVVTQKVPPQGRHAGLQYAICELINRLTRLNKVAWALPELRTTYAERSRVPDIAVYRWERIPRSASGEIADHFLLAPDIAIEIVSPGQSVNRLVLRCTSFVEFGVQVALLVDPDDDSIVVFRPGAAPAGMSRGDIINLGDVVPGLTLSVSEVFDALIL